ncbi:MAG: winged helix-turn-helix domain-containing protein [Parcubacteria group bacterium]|jgi:hypothetical protein
MSDSLKIYAHKERGHIFINFFEGIEKWEAVELLKDVVIPKFRFQVSSRREEGSWGSIISVFWKGRRLGGINLKTGKFSVDTKQGLRQGVEELLAQLGKYIPLDVSWIHYDYVEICTRFPREHFQRAVEIMREFKEKYRTTQSILHTKEHDSIDGVAECLANNMLFSNRVLNLKIYRFYDYDTDKKFRFKNIRGESLLKNPKFEIQIDEPETMENALREAVPIMIAFFKELGCEPTAMDETDEIDDYQLVEQTAGFEKYGQKIFDNISRGNKIYIPHLYGFDFTGGREARRNKMLALVAKKPRTIKEIKEELNVCRNTISADLKWLEERRLIEVRGRHGLAHYHAATLPRDWDNIPAPACSNANIKL